MPGNVATCAAAGFPGTVQMGSPSNTSASDGAVAGDVQPNGGVIQSGRGQELNVTITDPDVVIDAVLVKGSNGFNVYSDPTVVPPALPPPQHYISPLTDGANVPDISHWFVCYHLASPAAAGSLTVLKRVIAPDGVPVMPLPSTYSVVVNCEGQLPVVAVFGSGGGRSIDHAVIPGLPIGTTCIVAEATGGLPPGAVVTYDPAGADTTGVVVPAGTGIAVLVTNDFSNVAVQTAELRLAKVLTGSPGAVRPDGYVAHVVCDDGTDALVSLPGAGGDGVPALAVRVGSLCALEEDTSSLPSGWTATYAVGTGAAGSGAIFQVSSSMLVVVTIVNDAGVAPTTTSSTVPATTSTTSPTISGGPPTGGGAEGAGDPGTLPATGGTLMTGALTAAAGLVLCGAVLLVARRRARFAPPAAIGHD